MENLQKMKEQGVRSVVNLRQASDYNFEEEAAMAKKLYLRYFHILHAVPHCGCRDSCHLRAGSAGRTRRYPQTTEPNLN